MLLNNAKRWKNDMHPFPKTAFLLQMHRVCPLGISSCSFFNQIPNFPCSLQPLLIICVSA